MNDDLPGFDLSRAIKESQEIARDFDIRSPDRAAKDTEAAISHVVDVMSLYAQRATADAKSSQRLSNRVSVVSIAIAAVSLLVAGASLVVAILALS